MDLQVSHVESNCSRIFTAMIAFLTSLFLVTVPVLTAECPECIIRGLQATCQEPDTVTVPDCLPSNITYLQLYNNNISVLTADSFRNYPNIEILVVDSKYLKSRAFDRVRMINKSVEYLEYRSLENKSVLNNCKIQIEMCIVTSIMTFVDRHTILWVIYFDINNFSQLIQYILNR